MDESLIRECFQIIIDAHSDSVSEQRVLISLYLVDRGFKYEYGDSLTDVDYILLHEKPYSDFLTFLLEESANHGYLERSRELSSGESCLYSNSGRSMDITLSSETISVIGRTVEMISELDDSELVERVRLLPEIQDSDWRESIL